MGLRGIGILPMIHGLEGPPQRGISRWGPLDGPTQGKATIAKLRRHRPKFLSFCGEGVPPLCREAILGTPNAI